MSLAFREPSFKLGFVRSLYSYFFRREIRDEPIPLCIDLIFGVMLLLDDAEETYGVNILIV